MNRIAYLVFLAFSLTLSVACSARPQAAVIPSSKAVAPTAAPLSTATAVPRTTATMAPISTSTAVPPPTTATRAASTTSPAKQTTPTGVPAVSPGADWKLYRDEKDGIEFRYPAACTVAQSDGSFAVGGRIELAIADARGMNLREYVNQFVDERTRTSGWKIDSQQTVTVGANSGIRVDYRFGGTNRFGTATFLEGKGQVYIWGLTAGGFTCDEGGAFDGIVSSFRSTR